MTLAFRLDELVNRELAAVQLERLRATVRHAYEHSPFYRRKMDALGVTPPDIQSLDDVRKLPLTDKEELREAYPFGLRAVPFEDIVRIHASSGTTGKKTVAYYTAKDIDDWSAMFARCYATTGVTRADRVQVTPGYGLWTAGIGFQLGAERLGALVIPAGPGNTEQQLELMLDFQTTVITGTSSYGLLLGEEIQARGLRDRLALRIGIFGSERWSDQMRARIEELLGVDTFDIIGMTELYGPGIGIDCPHHTGIHYWADHFIFEVLDPTTGEPTAPGARGEIVATTLSKEAMPLLRYRTRDISAYVPGTCPCGSPFPRIERILARTDDMIKVHGVNIFPGQIDAILSATPGLSSEYQIMLSRDRGRDSLTIKVERSPDQPLPEVEVASRLQEQIKGKIGVTARVELVEYHALPRTERKTRRVFDSRD